ncbi:transposable element Tcb1 transposase [Trichonephila clavipes]|nr:transposable element Tcb1 transposase [Trichonephila clavipes]
MNKGGGRVSTPVTVQEQRFVSPVLPDQPFSPFTELYFQRLYFISRCRSDTGGRLRLRFQVDGNVSRCYSTGVTPRVTTPNEDWYLELTAKRNRRSTASDLSRQFSSATGTTVPRQTVYRRLGHINLYARRPVRCVPLTATHCHLRLTFSREHALWTPQHWSCVMFSDVSRFILQSDSHRNFIWRAPGTRYHQENTIERHRYGGAGWLVWGGIILGSRTHLHVQSMTMTGHIYRDVILEQHVRLFRGAMGAEFLFMDDNARPHRANILDECLQSEDITRMDWPAYSPDLNPIEHVWDMLGRRIAARQPLPPVYRNFGGHCLMSGVIFPKIRLII